VVSEHLNKKQFPLHCLIIENFTRLQKKNIVRILPIILFLFLSNPALAQKVVGKIIHVKDGDSFLMTAEGKTIEVRLEGIDCPEKAQPFSAKAKQFTTTITLNKTVTLKINGYDKYKRALGIVYLPGNQNLNEELVKAGYAWHFKKYSDDKRLARFEVNARNSKIGLWQDPSPIPPWEYRKIKYQKKKTTN
jgi:endonuclease YncB( thermonuclease family)